MAEDGGPRADIPEGEDRKKQEILDAYGWGPPDVLADELLELKGERSKKYLEQVREAFNAATDNSETALNQAVIGAQERADNTNEIILDSPIKGTVPTDPRIVSTMRRGDLEMLLAAVMAEKREREHIPWDVLVRKPRKSEDPEEKSIWERENDYMESILRHESQHAAAYAGKIIDPQTGEPVDDEIGIVHGFQIVQRQDNKGRFDLIPFTTFTGQVSLRDLIEATAAPSELSRPDIRILELYETRLKQAGVMLPEESILNPEDRRKMYERGQKPKSEQTS